MIKTKKFSLVLTKWKETVDNDKQLLEKFEASYENEIILLLPEMMISLELPFPPFHQMYFSVLGALFSLS